LNRENTSGVHVAIVKTNLFVMDRMPVQNSRLFLSKSTKRKEFICANANTAITNPIAMAAIPSYNKSFNTNREMNLR
jgi:hypothetical protein